MWLACKDQACFFQPFEQIPPLPCQETQAIPSLWVYPANLQYESCHRGDLFTGQAASLWRRDRLFLEILAWLR